MAFQSMPTPMAKDIPVRTVIAPSICSPVHGNIPLDREHVADGQYAIVPGYRLAMQRTRWVRLQAVMR